VELVIVVAASENDVIGRHGRLPWRLPEDMRRFRRLTWGKPVLMGRRTFESIGQPLAGRRNIVISREPALEIPGVEAAATPAEALASVRDVPEVMIIGGGEIYRQLLPRTDRIEMTRVHMTVEGDTFFPKLDPREWQVVWSEHFPVTPERSTAFTFETLERR
jgi:dihydrofolate reductase